jgi:hypothetical protein
MEVEMAFIAVIDYEAGWNVKGDQSKILIKLEDGTSWPFTPTNPSEFLAVLALLQGKKPVFVDRDAGIIRTFP